MDNLKFILASIFVIGILGSAGYWAFSTMESGSAHVSKQKQQELENKNEELQAEVDSLKRQVVLFELEKEPIPEPIIEPETEPIKKPTTTPTTTVLKYQTLINDLQKLVDGNIYLKRKSQGSTVGSVQKFLNIYNNTSNKVDNDFGASTETAVKNFQKAQGLTADGEVGPGTFKKMISWLKTK